MIVAAERVLAKHGVAGFTTNHVAEVAGVSIGTLYQYFPNKQAIVATLIERNANQFAELVTEVLDAHPTAVPETVALAIASGLVERFRTQGRVHFQLYEQIPTLGLINLLEAALEKLTDRLARWLASNPHVAVPEPRATAWVFVRAIEGIARGFAIASDVDVLVVARQAAAMLLSAVPRRRANSTVE
jgi:AcrR family transcriptional regulator